MSADLLGPNSGVPIPDLNESDIRRFTSKFIPGGKDDCWVWKKPNKDGYGRFSLNGRSYKSHRVAFMITNGALTPGAVVSHKCNNPSCCNPAHLELSTQSENVRYSYNLGRTVIKRNKGSDCKQSKMTAEKVVALRNDYASGLHSQTALAAKYGINQTCVGAIVRRKNWKHVP